MSLEGGEIIMDKFNFEKCNGCPYYFGEVDQCMIGDDGVPDDFEKKCEKGDIKND